MVYQYLIPCLGESAIALRITAGLRPLLACGRHAREKGRPPVWLRRCCSA